MAELPEASALTRLEVIFPPAIREAIEEATELPERYWIVAVVSPRFRSEAPVMLRLEKRLLAEPPSDNELELRLSDVEPAPGVKLTLPRSA